ncbi:FAD-dependent oxidoreductase [Virgibacillus phasianinus]|uniref:FAD-dependent oxidoreductase n=1 Tax=Virgibacillus phasianinus TaxID=2017483 RepID=A0A220TY22_9BACI|nr:FAD-dependent oxidoreductase [Virgibacillus phasianinus]ASK60884.1 FAD-dependent oxidoreductase [Virgibacillus phasianinus]
MPQNSNTGGKLPETTTSYWTDSIDQSKFPALDEDIQVDVCIVGGGITGITSAYLLANAGLKIAVLEADQILNGTTGHTTAKITAQHDLIYDELITSLGKSKAKLYYEANMEAITFIKDTVNELQIDCEFSEQDAYMYATTDEDADKIEKEMTAYEKLGINGGPVETFPLDIDIKNAIMMRGQAQFHPLKYLTHLVEKITEKGGLIYENTTAVNVEDRKQPVVLTSKDHRVTAKHVLACSHFPFYEGLGLYSTRMYADRSYILAAKPKKSFPGGIFISAGKPTRSIRSVTIDGEEMVLIVGESHKTGQGLDTMKHYQALEDFGQQVFGLEDIPYRWSAQDLTTLDKVPYIGEITFGQPNILIATGYRKWGMSNGTAAALLLRDIVLGKENAFQRLFTPSRFYATPSIKNFLVQNADVAEHLIKGKLQISNIDPDTLNNDEAAVISIKGERKGAYKDEKGQLHIVDTTCTHVGCEVEWNSGDRSWDCPCHGSRFSYTGDVIEGPAEKPLQKHDYKMLDNLTSEDSGY